LQKEVQLDTKRKIIRPSKHQPYEWVVKISLANSDAWDLHPPQAADSRLD
jgi:hypothetical protein